MILVANLALASGYTYGSVYYNNVGGSNICYYWDSYGYYHEYYCSYGDYYSSYYPPYYGGYQYYDPYLQDLIDEEYYGNTRGWGFSLTIGEDEEDSDSHSHSSSSRSGRLAGHPFQGTGSTGYTTTSTGRTTPYCGDGSCNSGETKYSCPEDCGTPNYCGDGKCDGGETKYNCATDCGTPNYCGDSKCDGGETKYNCPDDCGNPAYCGDGACNGGETRYSCAQDCGNPPYCGNGYCDGGETRDSCPEDCGTPAYCGDGLCNAAETRYSCPEDCGNPPYCGDGYCNGGETQYTCSLDCGYPSCTNPSGTESQRICEDEEILECRDGFWEFIKSVDCCTSSDCPSDEECNANRCVDEDEDDDDDCKRGFTGEYRCSGNSLQEEYQYADCYTEWRTIEECEYDCDDERCVSAPCTAGYTNDYRCSGEYRQRKFKNSDCSTEWRNYERCYYGCDDGACTAQQQPVNNKVEVELLTETHPSIRVNESLLIDFEIENTGGESDVYNVSLSGDASDWVDNPPVGIGLNPGESRVVKFDLNVPYSAEPDVYPLYMRAKGTKSVSSERVIYLGVLPEVVSNDTDTNTTDDQDGTSPTGAFGLGSLLEDPWVLFGIFLALSAIFLGYLAYRNQQPEEEPIPLPEPLKAAGKKKTRADLFNEMWLNRTQKDVPTGG